MVDDKFTGALSLDQLDGAAVEFGNDYLALGCAAYFDWIFWLDVGRIYLA
jgi:hypothetical protein